MPRGGKRAFDEEAALDVALELFWRQGYEATSIADLTEAMDIRPPSLYAAFGNKRELFEKVLHRYAEARSPLSREALAQPTAREVALRLLTGLVEAYTTPGKPRGCLTVQAGLASGEDGRAIVEVLKVARDDYRRAVQDRFEKAVADGDLPAGTDCRTLARFLMATAEGLAVNAASDAPREELMAAAVLAVQVIPAG
ncbi:TetR/AcrR family transcriptional regulator [Streptomyces phyllanthi]|uniref:TetR/AcrR family transcriptional regulator n=1 Tax=Streptomyces phyllanthi TaxID=1803180 RepID=A0A5N8WCG3_9ACTN|nr:TetR/AcrR family transcriptional regulator [Streptomyces phyllanthi]MPY43835.1 TetR/AcrR family transcriptional regulator [Streptomyces phyllanthi]